MLATAALMPSVPIAALGIATGALGAATGAAGALAVGLATGGAVLVAGWLLGFCIHRSSNSPLPRTPIRKQSRATSQLLLLAEPVTTVVTAGAAVVACGRPTRP